MRPLFIVIATIVLVSGCRFPKFKDPNKQALDVPGYAVVFHRIDETATLVINGEVVFENEVLVRQSEDPVIFDIKQYLRVGENSLEISLSDTPQGQCMNNEWGINYDLHIEGELFDYWQQQNEGADCIDGVKVVKDYTIEIAAL